MAAEGQLNLIVLALHSDGSDLSLQGDREEESKAVQAALHD
jgi:hypothetical protein